MIFRAVFLAGAVAASTASAAPASASRQLYRLELTGNQTLWSQDRPVQSGSLIVFHRFPDGVLLSVKRGDVLHIVAAKYEPAAARSLKPGSVVELGATGGGSGARPAAGRGAATAAARRTGTQPAPGERSDGTALFNPDRPYFPDWDSKLVPGMNIPYPASPNDYVEGKTFAYPPAPATQAAPGDLPRAQTETGDPKSPQ